MWLFHCAGSCFYFLFRLQLHSLSSFPLYFYRETISHPHRLYLLLSKWSPWTHKVFTKKTSDEVQEGWNSAEDGAGALEDLPVCGYCFHLCSYCFCCQPEGGGVLTVNKPAPRLGDLSQTGTHFKMAVAPVKYIPLQSQRKEPENYFSCEKFWFICIPISLSRKTQNTTYFRWICDSKFWYIKMLCLLFMCIWTLETIYTQ